MNTTLSLPQSLITRSNQPRSASSESSTRQLAYVIFASPKSGTTWVQRLLSAHPETICCESRPFGDYLGNNAAGSVHITLEKYVRTLSAYFGSSAAGLQSKDSDFYETLLFDLIDTLGKSVKRHLGKSLYGEKFTPFIGTGTASVEALFKYNPDLKFIHLVRDGRDVLVSGAAQWMNQRRASGLESQRAEAERQLAERILRKDDFDRFVDLWINAISAGIAAKSLFPNFLELKYEELLADTSEGARRLFMFLNIDDSPEVISRSVQTASFKALSGGRATGEEDRSSFFRRGISGDWRNWFKPEHTALFNTRAGTYLEQLGYLKA